MKSAKNFLTEKFDNLGVIKEGYDEDIVDEPSEDDAFLSPSGILGSLISVSIGGKFIGTFKEYDDAVIALGDFMENNKFWPTVWNVSDHGNYSIVEDFQQDYKKAKDDIGSSVEDSDNDLEEKKLSQAEVKARQSEEEDEDDVEPSVKKIERPRGAGRFRKSDIEEQYESIQYGNRFLKNAQRWLGEDEELSAPTAEQKQASSIVWTKDDFKDESDEELISSWGTWADPMPWYMNQMLQGHKQNYMQSKKFIVSDIQSLKNLIDVFLERMASKETNKQ